MSDGDLKALGCILTLLVLLAGVVGGNALLSSAMCHWAWDGSGRQARYSMFVGCQVHDGKGWVPAENFRAL
jgi:hypothetical protein